MQPKASEQCSLTQPTTYALHTAAWILTPILAEEARSTIWEMTPIARLVLEASLILVRTDAPYATLKDFIEAGVRPSMGSVGDAYDNAMCESFFATLECELLDRRRFASQAGARMACFSFIEGWYNPVRLHSALGYRSPMAYEAEMENIPAET